MNKKVQWIYRPKSGDRVFAMRDSNKIVVVTWSDGCRHVVGGWHMMVRETKRYREPLRRIATAVVNTYRGGIAWDERGDIHLVAPWQSAIAWFDWTCRLLPELRAEVDNAMWLAGIGQLAASDDRYIGVVVDPNQWGAEQPAQVEAETVVTGRAIPRSEWLLESEKVNGALVEFRRRDETLHTVYLSRPRDRAGAVVTGGGEA